LYLNGNDMMDMLELDGSPIIGKLITALREAQVTGEVLSEEDARDFIRQQYDLL